MIRNHERSLALAMGLTGLLLSCDGPMPPSSASETNPTAAAEPAAEPTAEAPAPTTQPAPDSQPAPSLEGAERVQLHIGGMMCEGCAQAARDALEALPGVREADVSFESGLANVYCEPGAVEPPSLVATLQDVEMGGKKMPFEVSIAAETP